MSFSASILDLGALASQRPSSAARPQSAKPEGAQSDAFERTLRDAAKDASRGPDRSSVQDRGSERQPVERQPVERQPVERPAEDRPEQVAEPRRKQAEAQRSGRSDDADELRRDEPAPEAASPIDEPQTRDDQSAVNDAAPAETEAAAAQKPPGQDQEIQDAQNQNSQTQILPMQNVPAQAAPLVAATSEPTATNEPAPLQGLAAAATTPATPGGMSIPAPQTDVSDAAAATASDAAPTPIAAAPATAAALPAPTTVTAQATPQTQAPSGNVAATPAGAEPIATAQAAEAAAAISSTPDSPASVMAKIAAAVGDESSAQAAPPSAAAIASKSAAPIAGDAQGKPDQAEPVQHAAAQPSKPGQDQAQTQAALKPAAHEAAKDAAGSAAQPQAAASGGAILAQAAPDAGAPDLRPQSPTPMRADPPVPLQAVAIEIGMRAMRGAKEFAIRLDPVELGRIDVKLEISDEGQVQAKVVVERVETLQLLQRDARTLERAFDQAGLKTNADTLQFSLRDPGSQGRGDGQPTSRPATPDRLENDHAIDEVVIDPARYRSAATSGLDIRI